jgi:hypothetical protein
MVHQPTANGFLEGLIKASLFGAMVAAAAGAGGCSVRTAKAATTCSVDADCVTTCRNTPNLFEKVTNNYTTVDIRCNHEKKCIRYVWAGVTTTRASDGTGLGQTAYLQICK